MLSKISLILHILSATLLLFTIENFFLLPLLSEICSATDSHHEKSESSSIEKLKSQPNGLDSEPSVRSGGVKGMDKPKSRSSGNGSNKESNYPSAYGQNNGQNNNGHDSSDDDERRFSGSLTSSTLKSDSSLMESSSTISTNSPSNNQQDSAISSSTTPVSGQSSKAVQSVPTETSSVITRSSFINFRPVKEWVFTEKDLGHVTGVTTDDEGMLIIFSRGDHVWDLGTFDQNHNYIKIPDGPIRSQAVTIMNPYNISITRRWGHDFFYLPHGITYDSASKSLWLTDLALHQVFKFPSEGSQKPTLALGTRFKPGSDNYRFCKPTSVAIDPVTKFVYVADGYCNHRIVIFRPDGNLIKKWGEVPHHDFDNRPILQPHMLSTPHKVIFMQDKDQACVADREHGRISCFDVKSQLVIKPPEMKGSVVSVSYSAACSSVVFALNGKGLANAPLRGYVINMETRQLANAFFPGDTNFSTPHDIHVTDDCQEVYIAESNPNFIWKFRLYS